MNIVPQDFVTVASNGVMTDSRTVAKHFDKQHRNVLQAIRNISCSPEFKALNFQQCSEINELANGKPEPIVRMTKDGFMFLVMGFTGREAARIKEAFIDAFNRMAEFIRTEAAGAWEQFNRAYMAMLVDEREASRNGRGLSVWKKVKRVHVARLAALHPQMQLAFAQ